MQTSKTATRLLGDVYGVDEDEPDQVWESAIARIRIESGYDQTDCVSGSNATLDGRKIDSFVFVREKDKPRTNVERFNDVLNMIQKSVGVFTGPTSAFKAIQNELDRANVQYWGLAVIRHADFLGRKIADIQKSAFSSTDVDGQPVVVWVARYKCTVCVLLK